MSSASKAPCGARCVLPSGRKAGCSGTNSGHSTCQGKALRTSSGWCASPENRSLCKLQPLSVSVAETDTFHTEQQSCSSNAYQRTLGLSVPWQWPGFRAYQEELEKSQSMPIPPTPFSTCPVLVSIQEEATASHFLTMSVIPAVEISLGSRGILPTAVSETNS